SSAPFGFRDINAPPSLPPSISAARQGLQYIYLAIVPDRISKNILAHMRTVDKDGDMDAQAILIVEYVPLHRWMTRKHVGKRAGHGRTLGFDGAVGRNVAQMRGEVDLGHGSH